MELTLQPETKPDRFGCSLLRGVSSIEKKWISTYCILLDEKIFGG
jgi:hypothetical protein